MTGARRADGRERRRWCAWLLPMLCLAFSSTADAAELAEFPSSLTIISGFAAGGGDERGGVSGRGAAARLQPQPGYDQTARLFARHIGQFLPGKPSVSLRFMPGAGSIRAAAHLAREAARDGSVLGVVASAALLAPLIGEHDPGYRLHSFAFVGGRSPDEYVCVIDGQAGAETLDDLKSRELAFGTSAPGRRQHTHVLLLKQLTDAPIRIVSGYKDNNEILLAMRRGEISGVCGMSLETYKAGLPGWMASGRLKPVLRLSPDWLETLRAVPRAQDLAREQGADANLIAALDFFAQEGAMAWALTAPAAISPDRLKILRAAFEAMQMDKTYLREAQRRNLDVDTVSTARIEAGAAMLAQTPGAALDLIRHLNAAP